MLDYQHFLLFFALCMAASYMSQYGIDLSKIISHVPGLSDAMDQLSSSAVYMISDVRLPGRQNSYDITISHGKVSAVEPHESTQPSISHISGVVEAKGGLLAPSLCHAHVHLDKCFLLQDEKYDDLVISKGDFAEAMSLTGQAKQRFTEEDVMRRAKRLIEESIEAGVTSMRAFVEMDEVAETKSLQAAVKLKKQYKDQLDVQLCAFAQLAVYDDKVGQQRRSYIEDALTSEDIEVIGSTPYVEVTKDKMKECVKWSITLALQHKKHLDFHLDYNIDPEQEPLVWYVLEELKRQNWKANALPSQTICLGHCTRLTLFNRDEWQRLSTQIGNLPISFVGLPTSDLFMMGRPEGADSQRPRATLQLPEMAQEYGLHCALSINNIGNAFTPWGPVDPISLVSLGMGVYQTGTMQGAELLYNMVSSRAKAAIGLEAPLSKDVQVGQIADFVLFMPSEAHPERVPRSLADVAYGLDVHSRRRTILRGRLSH